MTCPKPWMKKIKKTLEHVKKFIVNIDRGKTNSYMKSKELVLQMRQ